MSPRSGWFQGYARLVVQLELVSARGDPQFGCQRVDAGHVELQAVTVGNELGAQN